MSGHAVVGVHLISRYQAMCHECGWSSTLLPDYESALDAANTHTNITVSTNGRDSNIPLTDRGQPRP